jgi:hypothetical protein
MTWKVIGVVKTGDIVWRGEDGRHQATEKSPPEENDSGYPTLDILLKYKGLKPGDFKETLVPDFCILKFNTTKYWRENIQREAGEIYNVYIFDANRIVHAADLSPSYELHYLGPTWTASCESEEERSRLFEQIMEGVTDTEPVTYHYCREVKLNECERVPITDEQWALFLWMEDGDQEKAYAEAIEKWSEHCQGNGWVY